MITGGHDLPYFTATGHHLVAELPSVTLLELPWAGHLTALERPRGIADILITHLS
ncbi:hypothetical protein [Acrocarpospora sp. B8E8]|uniref:alpha/beta fold hydrolase n=1 Tax=Acrocarpospora sp. B8E8 TaxID=3153572 RepID=UPI00325D5F63